MSTERSPSEARSALERATPAIYDELRRIAAFELARSERTATMQTTALVHDAWLRLRDQRKLDDADRQHFLGIAAKVIRRTLVDHARARRAAKRGGDALRITLSDAEPEAPGAAPDMVALDDALHRLHELDARQAQVVELRYFAGLSVDETARVLGVSPRTVDGAWSVARAWLARELGA